MSDNETKEIVVPEQEVPVHRDPNESAFELMQRKAYALSQSDLMPDNFRDNVANCMLALELSQRIGMSALMVAQNIHVIHGRPSFASAFLIGCVNASQRFTPLRYRFESEKGSDDWGCRAVANDMQTGEEIVGPLVTWRTAQEEGWTKKKGSQASKWITMPELMFSYRAGAWFARLHAPDITMGLLTLDEVQDVEASDRAQARQEAAASSEAAGAAIEAAAALGRESGEVDAQGNLGSGSSESGE